MGPSPFLCVFLCLLIQIRVFPIDWFAISRKYYCFQFFAQKIVHNAHFFVQNHIFASIFSMTYFIVILFFFLYVGTALFMIIFDLVLLIFGISAAVQSLYSHRKVEKVSVYVPKSARSPEDSSIIIIQDENIGENSRETNLIIEGDYTLEQEMTEVRSNYDGLIVIILGLVLSFHFILLQYLGTFLIGSVFMPLPFQYTLIHYQFFLVLFGLCLILLIYIAFKSSYRFRGYTTRTMSERAAFMKFLSLIDEKERKRFLTQISKTVKEILVGGVMDLIEAQRRRWQEDFDKGRKFLRRLFGRDEEEK